MPNAETFVNVGGEQRKIGANGISVNVSGTWQNCTFAYAHSAGSWQTVYVRDNTGPAAPTAATATWEGNGLRVNWTNPPDADYSYMIVTIVPWGQPPLPSYNVAAPTATTHYSAYILNGAIYTAYLTPVDIYGNAGSYTVVQSMGWTGAPRGRTNPDVLFKMYSIDSGTWRTETGGWRPDGYGQAVYQGASVSGINFGTFFYGSQAYDNLRGATIYGANMEMERKNSGGLGTTVPCEYMWSDNCTSKASNPAASNRYNYTIGEGMARNGDSPPYTYLNFNVGFLNALKSNTQVGSLSSVIFNSGNNTLNPGIGNVSNSYMIMAGAYEGPYTLRPGLINVSHSG